MLLAVAEVLRGDAHAHDVESSLQPAVGRFQLEADADGRAVRHAHLLLLLHKHLLSGRIEQLHRGGAAERLVAHVHHAGADGTLIVLAQESRHVGLYHQVFLGHGLVAHLAEHHVLGMGHTEETPGGEALGQGELHLHQSCGVSH